MFADDKEKKKRVLAAVKAGTITIVWNLWFFVPFFDYFRSGFAIMDDTSVFLPDRTVYLSQVFTFLSIKVDKDPWRVGRHGGKCL